MDPSQEGIRLTSRSALFWEGAVPVAHLLPLLLHRLLSLDERLLCPPPPCGSLYSMAAPLFFRQLFMEMAINRRDLGRNRRTRFALLSSISCRALVRPLLNILMAACRARTRGIPELELSSHFWKYRMGWIQSETKGGGF